MRAEVYLLLATLLSGPPDAAQLATLGRLVGDRSAVGVAIDAVAKAARASTPAREAEAFQDLFIGLGRGEFVPYGSFYLTGFLNEKPLARLRDDMARIGIGRTQASSDPEDHAAAILEMMAGLITGRFGPAATIEQQRAFFTAHVGSWMGHFFTDLGATGRSEFYGAAGRLGEAFVALEEEAFRYA